MIFAAVTAVVLLPGVAAGQSAAVDGGRSPDGGHEVRVVRTPHYDPDKDGSEYNFRIESSKGKSVLTLPGNGFCHFSAAPGCCKALWDQSGQFVAVTDKDSRHTNVLYVASVTDTDTTRFELPNYVQNALGRVDAVEVDRSCVTTLKRWDGDDLIVELSFDAHGYRTDTFEVRLHIRREPLTEGSAGLKSMTKLSEGGG